MYLRILQFQVQKILILWFCDIFYKIYYDINFMFLFYAFVNSWLDFADDDLWKRLFL